MKTSIIIPVWNGETVILDSLQALYQQTGSLIDEVICVDNASVDQSAALIATHYPQVRLLPQPVNLGFAGGVNTGMRAAQGDLFILLNQDCLVGPNWLPPIRAALEQNSNFGILGCTILNADGTVNHAGAHITRPSLYGEHLTQQPTILTQIQQMEFVTGAVFAIRRTTWQTVGEFDIGFYPAYYEETDYCYRARSKGILTGYVPNSYARHLFSSRQWQQQPVRHTANQHQSRYRFAIKHLTQSTIQEFLQAESVAIEQEGYFDQAIGRVLAARHTMRNLPLISQQRSNDTGLSLTVIERQQFESGFAQIQQQALQRAMHLSKFDNPPQQETSSTPKAIETQTVYLADLQQTAYLADLQQQAEVLMARIYFRPLDVKESSTGKLRRWVRQFMLRPLSILSGRDSFLHAKLSYLHALQIKILSQQLQAQQHLSQQHLSQQLQAQQQATHHFAQSIQALAQEQQQQLKVLEILQEYDYR